MLAQELSMIDQFTLLYYLCEFGGLVMIVGGILLIYKEKIYIDSTTNQVTEIDVPFFGKLKTNVPALALFALGFIPLIYPITRVRTAYLQVRGSVTSELPVIVYAVVESKALTGVNGDFDLPVPVIENPSYTPEVIYIAGRSKDFIVDHDKVEMNEQNRGVISLRAKVIVGKKEDQTFKPDISKPPEAFKQ
jgi:hypothetical protein